MTAMYNNVQAAEKENENPNKDKGNPTKENKSHCTKEVHQSQCIQGKIMQAMQAGGTLFRKILF